MNGNPRVLLVYSSRPPALSRSFLNPYLEPPGPLKSPSGPPGSFPELPKSVSRSPRKSSATFSFQLFLVQLSALHLSAFSRAARALTIDCETLHICPGLPGITLDTGIQVDNSAFDFGICPTSLATFSFQLSLVQRSAFSF